MWDEPFRLVDAATVAVGAGDLAGAARLAQLEEELAIRREHPAGHPRRVGGVGNVDEHPVIFEFDLTGLAPRRRGDVRPGGALGGEAHVFQPIDLRTRIVRVYAPAERLDAVRARVASILGHDRFEALPMESLRTLPPRGDLGETRAATWLNILSLNRAFDRMQRLYDLAVREGRPISLELYLRVVNEEAAR